MIGMEPIGGAVELGSIGLGLEGGLEVKGFRGERGGAGVGCDSMLL